MTSEQVTSCDVTDPLPSPDAAADREATEMLTDNAQNLMQAVSEVLFATEAATIRVPPDQRATLGLQWVKKGARTLQ